MMRRMLRLAFLAAALALQGCAPPVQLAGIRRVAIMTPEIKMGPQSMAIQVKQELFAQIPRRFTVQVVDGLQIESALPGGPPKIADLAWLAALCREYDIDALVISSITEYNEKRAGGISAIATGDRKAARAAFRVDLGVDLTLDASLLKIADRSFIFSRSVAGTAARSIIIDPVNPLAGLDNLLKPHFQELRRQAINNAVWQLTREIYKEYR